MSDSVCPHCKKPIYDEEAVLCHFCGGSLGRTSSGLLGAMRGAGFKWVWITVALVLAAVTLLTLF